MEGSNVYHDFLPLISGESGTIMICQWSVRSHSTEYVLEFYRLSWETWAGKHRNPYVLRMYPDVKDHSDMLGIDYCHLPWGFHLERFACRADPRNTVSNDLLGLGYSHNRGNRHRQLLPSWRIIPFAFDSPDWLEFTSNTEYSKYDSCCLYRNLNDHAVYRVQSIGTTFLCVVTGLLMTVTDYSVLRMTIKICGQCSMLTPHR